MILSVFDYCIIIYLVMYVISVIVIFHHLCRPNNYRLIISCLVSLVWPIVAGLLIITWVEEFLCTIKELITKE
jgi:hypothetical protein